jgi:class 3 adenylate cyclase
MKLRIKSVNVKLSIAMATLITGIGAIPVTCLGSYFLFSSEQIARNAVIARLQDVTRLVDADIDVKLHDRIHSKEDIHSFPYAKLNPFVIDALKKISGSGYIYTVRNLDRTGRPPAFGNHRLVFILDSLEFTDPIYAPPGTPFPLARNADALIRVWRQKELVIDRSFVHDQFGTWLSAYMPLKRPDGSFDSVIGVDISVESVDKFRLLIMQQTILAVLIVLIVSIPIGTLLGRSISVPIRNVTMMLRRLSTLDVEDLAIDGNSKGRWLIEIEEMYQSVLSLASALDGFSKYVPAALVRKLLDCKNSISLGGESKNLAVMFTDIRDFTTIAESLPPAESVSRLNEYFTVITSVINETSGTVDKFIGDCVMAFWGAPEVVEQSARQACLAAMRARDQLHALNQRRVEQGLDGGFFTRFGLHYGNCIVGNIGSVDRINYTIVGDNVNLASRIESLNKGYMTELLATGELVLALGDAASEFVFVLVDIVRVKGKEKPVSLYELRGFSAQLDQREVVFAATMQSAMDRFMQADFDGCQALLWALDTDFLALPYVAKLLQKCEQLKASVLPADWDPIEKMTHK